MVSSNTKKLKPGYRWRRQSVAVFLGAWASDGGVWLQRNRRKPPGYFWNFLLSVKVRSSVFDKDHSRIKLLPRSWNLKLIQTHTVVAANTVLVLRNLYHQKSPKLKLPIHEILCLPSHNKNGFSWAQVLDSKLREIKKGLCSFSTTSTSGTQNQNHDNSNFNS